MHPRLIALVVAVGVAGAVGSAAAYPQFQLSRDQTCTGCHVSPAGGGLLNENGLSVAESISSYGGAPEFFYKKVKPPGWLTLGGDVRAAGGLIDIGDNPTGIKVNDPNNNTSAFAPAVFPMQLDIYADAKLPSGFSLRVTVGARPTEWDEEATTFVWSREHYLMWQSKPGENEGVFVRVGRFMPVIGLRFAEHVDYNRQYGGTPLYYETYGAAVEYVTQKLELHASGFVKDPLIDVVNHDNGGALYAETRLTQHFAIGAEGMYTQNDDLKTVRGGVTAKVYLPGPDLLFQAEGQAVTERVQNNGDRGAPAQLVGYLMVTKMFGQAIMADLGIGHFDENIRIQGLDRDAVDLNVHWFLTSHLELMLQNRASITGLGPGPGAGPIGGWSMLQAHYRL